MAQPLAVGPFGFHNPPNVMTNCPRCGRENPPENEFCGRCGLELASVSPTVEPSPEDVLYCYKHPKEATQLRCGRCERPICHRCVVISPAGTRCRECSKSNVPIRPGAIVHEARVGARSILRMGPYGIWIWVVIISMVLGLVRGCASFGPGPNEREPEIEAPAPSESGSGETV